MRKVFSLIVALALAAVSLTTTSAPASAIGTQGEGSIYYVGGWQNGTWMGIRRYDVATGDDYRLNLDSPSCVALTGGGFIPSGLAVDIKLKRIFWSATDGVSGVFGFDMKDGTCHVLQQGGNPYGLAVVNHGNGEVIVWGETMWDQWTGERHQYLVGWGLSDILWPDIVNYQPSMAEFAVPGYSSPYVTDIERNGDNMYILAQLTNDTTGISSNFIFSMDPTNISYQLVADTGVTDWPKQLAFGPDGYYVSSDYQIYRNSYGDNGASWGMMTNQTSGVTVVGNTLYSAVNRDEALKTLDLTDPTATPQPTSATAPVDLFSYLVYDDPIPVPVISANSTNSSGGSAYVPFTGTSAGTYEYIQAHVTPKDGSAPYDTICTVVGTSCRIDELDDNLMYEVTLRLIYYFNEPSDPTNPMRIILASGPSNTIKVNEPEAPVLTTTTTTSSNGNATVAFAALSLPSPFKLHYFATPNDNSATLEGFCDVNGNNCLISGLDATKDYEVKLTKAYVTGSPEQVRFESAKSNAASVSHPTSTPPTPNNLRSARTFTGFEFEKPTLTTSTKKAIKAWLNGKTGYTKVTCVGYTGFNWNKRSAAYLNKLALQRATNVCNYIHQLKPGIQVTSKTAKRDTSNKDAARRVIATITN